MAPSTNGLGPRQSITNYEYTLRTGYESNLIEAFVIEFLLSDDNSPCQLGIKIGTTPVKTQTQLCIDLTFFLENHYVLEYFKTLRLLMLHLVYKENIMSPPYHYQ